MKLQDLPSPYRELAEMRREQLKDTDFSKQWAADFAITGALASAFLWEASSEGDGIWDEVDEGKLPEIPASSLAELSEWQKSKGEKVEPTQQSVVKVMIKKATSPLAWYANQIGNVFLVEVAEHNNNFYSLLGDDHRFIEKDDCEIVTQQSLIGGKTDTEWLYLFAGQAMQGVLANHSFNNTDTGYVAKISATLSKDLLNRLKKEVENV